MDVRIAQPVGYSEPGGRSNNEDSIFPDPRHVSAQQKWFMVCDGVGGAERGEVASRLAVVSLDTFLQLHSIAVVTPSYIQQAIAYVESQFNTYLTDNEQASGMATTLTLLYIHEAGSTVVHVGDSRIYHIRNGQVLWKTEDHSYVAELVKSGVLTPEEAHRHPQRNVITRALQGGTKPTQATVHLIEDLRAGDYFFLCSDGVLERVNDTVLVNILNNTTESNEQKMDRLRAYSMGSTRDNFTAYLIQIDQVTGVPQIQNQSPTQTYNSFFQEIENDGDEAITLINAPIPEAVKNYVSLERSGDNPVTSETDSVGTESIKERTAKHTPSLRAPAHSDPPIRRLSGRWSVLAVALIGALIGAGGFLIWQQFDDSRNQEKRKNETGQANVSAITAVPPAAPKLTQQTDQYDDSSLDEQTTNTSSSSVGLSLTSERHSPETSADPPNARYEVVREVDNKLLVIRDIKTKLLGLQKPNGGAVTDRVYNGIGSFKNGIAEVESNRVQARYLSKEGDEYSSFSDYKDGIATLVDLNGKDHYLSQGGKWLDEVKSPSNGKIAVCKNKRWGYLNMQGQVSIFLQYDHASSFDDDGTAEVSLNGKTYRIDKKGDRIVRESGPLLKERDDKKNRNLSKRDA